MTQKKEIPQSVTVFIKTNKNGFLNAYKRNIRISQVSGDAVGEFFGKISDKYQVRFTLNNRGRYKAYFDLRFHRMGILDMRRGAKPFDAVCFLPRAWVGLNISRKVLPWDYKEEITKKGEK